MLIRYQFEPIRNENCLDDAIGISTTLTSSCHNNFHPIRDPSTIANQIAEAFVSKPVQIDVSEGISWWQIRNVDDIFIFITSIYNYSTSLMRHQPRAPVFQKCHQKRFSGYCHQNSSGRRRPRRPRGSLILWSDSLKLSFTSLKLPWTS